MKRMLKSVLVSTCSSDLSLIPHKLGQVNIRRSIYLRGRVKQIQDSKDKVCNPVQWISARKEITIVNSNSNLISDATFLFFK